MRILCLIFMFMLILMGLFGVCRCMIGEYVLSSRVSVVRENRRDFLIMGVFCKRIELV